MEKAVRLFADGVGEIGFDGARAVASLIDVGYPQINRIVSRSAAPMSEKTEALTVGGSELVFEGYFLDRSGSSLASKLRAKLCAIAAPGREFTLFAAEAPFGTGLAEKFRLTAFSDDPYFHAGERTFCGEAEALDPIALPAALPRQTGTSRCVGTLRIENDGDETCGVVIEVGFDSDASEFHVTSDREPGRMFMGRDFDAGEGVVIDTTPGRCSIVTDGGESLLECAAEGCAFFLAPPGETVLTWNSFSVTPPSVTARITPGYLSV